MHRRQKNSDLESKNVTKGSKNEAGDRFSARCKELFMNSVKRIEMERLHKKLGAGRVTITEIFDDPYQNEEVKAPDKSSASIEEPMKAKAIIDPDHSVYNNNKIKVDNLNIDDSESSEVDGKDDYMKWNFSTDGSELGNALYFRELQKIIFRKDQFKEIYNMLCSSDEEDNLPYQ